MTLPHAILPVVLRPTEHLTSQVRNLRGCLFCTSFLRKDMASQGLPCVMCILSFPSKIWARKYALYTAEYGNPDGVTPLAAPFPLGAAGRGACGTDGEEVGLTGAGVCGWGGVGVGEGQMRKGEQPACLPLPAVLTVDAVCAPGVCAGRPAPPIRRSRCLVLLSWFAPSARACAPGLLCSFCPRLLVVDSRSSFSFVLSCLCRLGLSLQPCLHL